jgi:O-acetyl-ADP-ribose deacetylase (regulator of RNase III)
MTLLHFSGDLFDSDAPALGHGVNVFGVMGAGIAVRFRREYPAMYEQYAAHCAQKLLQPGRVFYWKDPEKPDVYNIASQDAPGANARLEWLEDGLDRALGHAATQGFDRIALPLIGCGIGGLQWDDVEPVYDALSTKHGVDIEVWTFDR